MTVQPFFSFRYSPIYPLASFLNRLLRPLVNRICRSTIFLNGADFIRRLDTFTKVKEQFSSSTYFMTLHIEHFYLNISHDYLRDSLSNFFQQISCT